MKVVTLVSWPGELFSYEPGAIIDNVPDEMAKARIEAGLMRAASEHDTSPWPIYVYPVEAEAKHNEAAAKAAEYLKAAEEAAATERAASLAAIAELEAQDTRVAPTALQAVEQAVDGNVAAAEAGTPAPETPATPPVGEAEAAPPETPPADTLTTTRTSKSA